MGCVADVCSRSFLYVLAPNATEIQVLSIQKAGEGKNIETLNIAGPTKAAGLTISMSYFFPCSLRDAHFFFTDPFNLQGMTTFITQ